MTYASSVKTIFLSLSTMVSFASGAFADPIYGSIKAYTDERDAQNLERICVVGGGHAPRTKPLEACENLIHQGMFTVDIEQRLSPDAQLDITTTINYDLQGVFDHVHAELLTEETLEDRNTLTNLLTMLRSGGLLTIDTVYAISERDRQKLISEIDKFSAAGIGEEVNLQAVAYWTTIAGTRSKFDVVLRSDVEKRQEGFFWKDSHPRAGQQLENYSGAKGFLYTEQGCDFPYKPMYGERRQPHGVPDFEWDYIARDDIGRSALDFLSTVSLAGSETSACSTWDKRQVFSTTTNAVTAASVLGDALKRMGCTDVTLHGSDRLPHPINERMLTGYVSARKPARLPAMPLRPSAGNSIFPLQYFNTL